MEAIEYKRLAAFEGWYWWYRAERALLLDTIGGLKPKPGSRLLDAGCGTGRNLIELANRLDLRGYGVDYSFHAAQHWHGSEPVHRCVGSVNSLPYDDERFDVVVCVDVMPCREAEPAVMMKEFARVISPGGALVVLAPAYQWLLSRHDRAVHCVRRFRRTDLRSLAHRAGLTVRRITHEFPLFFPVIAGVRLIRRISLINRGTSVRSDLSMLPRWLNGALFQIARWEQRVIRRTNAPFGSTILMLAGKEKA